MNSDHNQLLCAISHDALKNMEYKIWISIYAAVVSTIVFTWRLYEFYYDRIGKLNITVKSTFRIKVYNNGEFEETESFLIVSKFAWPA